jgi:hypothetical protein
MTPKSDLAMKNHSFVKTVFLLAAAAMSLTTAKTQTCPASATITINTYPNTYYPGTQATVNTGATSIVIGNASTAGYGTTPISAYDIVLIIQMQGAQITSTNSSAYGNSTATGSGYLNNANLVAGKMEYAVAAAAVPLTGGTLTLQTALVNSYKNANYSTDGQYRYQVIRIPMYYNLTLGANLRPPEWNGTVGGVIDFYVSQTLNMNGHTIDASGTGFRGGGGKNYSNVGSGANTDFVALSTDKAGGSKGEGIAGTPIYLDSMNSTTLITGALEGYPGGSYDRGAPGNAGGGATDGDPISNSNNAGGGGGSNGGAGGGGGNSWSSNLAVGGRGGTLFAQESPSRLVMGGGGGAGSTDGGTGTPANGLASSGAPGGGIIIITAASITGTGSMLSNGAAPNTTLLNDGSGGGGAGGSILIVTGAAAAGLTVSASGSAGAGNTGAGAKHGPGGGGGGGVVYSNKTLGSVSVTGGAAGVTAGGVNYGATAGAAGITSQSITISQTPTFPIICNGVLAINYLSASAIDNNGNIVIGWQVSEETDVREYEVERSVDSSNFSSIATFTPNNSSEYRYTDMFSGSGAPVIYYRIMERDVNGSITYSNIVAIERPGILADLAIAPNPTSGTATLRFANVDYAIIPIYLFDLMGHPVWYKQYQAVPGMNTVQLDHLQQLPNGIYVLKFSTTKNNLLCRISVLH